MMRAYVLPVVLFLATFTWIQTGFSAGLLIADGGMGGILEIEEQKVDVTINNGIAVTTVDQTFQNTENRIVEALYMFPVPNGASVANFSMWINGKEMIGEVLEKQRAREIYESYKERKVDPGLLEQVDFKTFELRVFPIPAGGQQRIKIVYYQELDFDNDWATYVYPLATEARSDVNQSTAGRFAINLRVLSEVPIQEMTSPSHPDSFVFSARTPSLHEASLESIKGDLSEDVVLAFRTQRPKTGFDFITSEPTREDGYFMLTMTAGDELEYVNESMDYVFVLDVSGSMAHESKLRLSRESLSAFIEALGPEDRFEVMTFNVEPTVLFGELRSAAEKPMQDAREFLVRQKAKGGTQLRHALRSAYKYGDPDRRLNVVVLSDGMTEQSNRSELLRLMEEKPEYATVFAIGVGNDVDRPLLSQVAEEGDGLAEFLSHGDDFQRKAQSFRRKLIRPVAKDIAFQFEGMDVYDVVPRRLPNLYHGAPVRVYGRFKNRKKESRVSVTADLLGSDYKVASSITDVDSDNPEIERMWASKQVSELLRDADRRGTRDQAKNRIVDLAETYSIVTEYTSFIVLENDGEYKRWKIKRRNANRMQRDDSHHEALREELDQIREKSMENLGPQLANRDRYGDVDSGVNVSAPSSSSSPSSSSQTFSKPSFQGSGSATPEPSSGVLMLLGAGWMMLRLRRTRTV